MLSVLIPIYNYNVVNLVRVLHKQLSNACIPFEIICFDDASNNSFIEYNTQIENFSNSKLILSKKNTGRVNARKTLCNKAKYNWLLFLDADVMPKSDAFVTNYINLMSQNKDAVFGGFAYKDVFPDADNMLRWKYGKKNEQVPAILRNRNPYRVIISANFLIKKNAFINVIANFKATNTGYGFDSYFAALLKKMTYSVFHIDNEVYHLGIEESSVYLSKKKLAAEVLLELYKDNLLRCSENSLLKLFKKLKHYKLNHLFGLIYKISKHRLERNLTGANPNIFLLQLYRICYMCFKDLNPGYLDNVSKNS